VDPAHVTAASPVDDPLGQDLIGRPQGPPPLALVAPLDQVAVAADELGQWRFRAATAVVEHVAGLFASGHAVFPFRPVF